MTLKFRAVNPDMDAKLTNDWRKDPRVEHTLRTSFRQSDIEQRDYLAKKEISNDYLHWIVQANGIDFAYFMALDYSPADNRISWGYWIGDQNFLGLGALIPPCFYNLIFETTRIQSIRAEVLSHNDKVLIMHKKMGYKEVETIETSTHNQDYALEHILVLDKKNWMSQPRSLRSIRADFDIPSRLDSIYSIIQL